MPRYRVSLRVVDYYSVDVEAESFDEAKTEAEFVEVPGEGVTHESGGELDVICIMDLATNKHRYYYDGIEEGEDA